jgi:hypothetical protein
MLNIKIIKIIPFLNHICNFRPNKENKGFALGTPIIVIDMKTGKSIEFLSINEAARYFNTYPKTV